MTLDETRTEPTPDDDDDGPSDEELAAWPNCATPDCEHKACLWGGTGRCHPCSVRLVGKREMDRRFAATYIAKKIDRTATWNEETGDIERIPPLHSEINE